MDDLSVFISSTWIDLVPERETLEHALHRLRSIRFVGMEYFGARSESTRQVSLDEVDRCDVYVGIIGHRYGSGITEAEYDRAIGHGLPCLIYLKDDWSGAKNSSDQDDHRLDSLRRKLCERHTVSRFHDAQDLSARVVADLHNLVFDRLVVHGINRLQADYDVRIQRFLAEYVGTKETPVAFGGREPELEALDRWLEDPQSPPYAMLCGPAGRGKSALLVHWAQRLTLRDDIALIFFPISIRFRTNLAEVAFASIAARLAALHGEALPAGVETPPEVWRELISAYLHRPAPDGLQLVLILDGADESAGWEPGPDLFPVTPGKGLHVLVSARYLAGDVDSRDWMTRLGWNQPRSAYPLDLRPLNPQGLIDVLRQMSLPLDALSARADIVAELFRLSNGDPLLVNLYVSDLWARGEEVARLQPEDLAGLEPGLDGYFRRWWEDQRTQWGDQSPLREPAVNDVLNTLACALGPLPTSALLDLLPPDSSVNLWALDDVMHALRRFVIGDGDRQGFAFSHPHLGDYFYERLSKAGRAYAQEQRFVTWGLSCLDELERGLREPEKVPDYLLHYLRLHMERAGSDAENFISLASHAWVSAWSRSDRGSYVGFINDLTRVREKVAGDDLTAASEGRPLPFLAVEIRCALYLSSIATLAGGFSVGLLKILIRRDLWSPEQGIVYASRIPDARSRLRSLYELSATTSTEYRPLAEAAALAESRDLLASDEGRLVVSSVLHDLSKPIEPNSSVYQTAQLFQAAGNVARRGLAPDDQQWMLETLSDSALQDVGTRAQSTAVRRRLAPLVDEPFATNLRNAADSALNRLAGRTEGSGLPVAAEALSLLCTALDNEEDTGKPPLLSAALRAGLKTLTAVTVTGSMSLDEALDLMLACWRFVPRDDVLQSLQLIAPALEDRQLDRIVQSTSTGSATTTSLDCLAAILEQSEKISRQRIASELINRLQGAPLSALETSHYLELVTEFIDVDALASRLAATAETSTSADQIALYGGLARAYQHSSEKLSLLADRALAAIAQLSTTEECLDAMVCLLDGLQPTGATDSFEPWRPDQEKRPLLPAIRQILQIARPAPAQVRKTAQHLLQSLEAQGEITATADSLRSRIAFIDRLDNATTADTTELPTLSEAARSLIGQCGAPSVEELSERLSAPDLGLPVTERFRLLDELAAALSAETARQAAARVLNHFEQSGYEDIPTPELIEIPSIVAQGSLYPPLEETIEKIKTLIEALWSRNDVEPGSLDALLHDRPMPDIIRYNLLATALFHASQSDTHAPRLDVVLRDICALSQLPKVLVSQSLKVLHDNQDLDTGTRDMVLKRLMPHIPSDIVPRWLGEMGERYDERVRQTLVQFEKVTLADRETHWRQLIAAIGRIRSPRRQAKWLKDIQEFLPAKVVPDAISMARGIEDAASRLKVLCVLIPLTPWAQRGDVLLDALKLAQSVQSPPEILFTLIQMAVDANLESPPLLDEAASMAAGITDRTLRNRAFAQLAEVLPQERLNSLVIASRQLGDAAARIRLMKRLALGVVDPNERKVAVSSLLSAVDNLTDDGLRMAATLVISPLIEPKQRWPILAQALNELDERVAGFHSPELMNALATVLVDAPAHLMNMAVAWIRRLPASAARSHTLAVLAPTLPGGLLLPTLALIADLPDEESITLLAERLGMKEFLRAKTHWYRLPQPMRDLLSQISAIDEQFNLPLIERVSLTSSSSKSVDHELEGIESEIERASILKWLALSRRVSTACRERLISATMQLRDQALRVATTPYLAALYTGPGLAGARDAIDRINSAGDRSIALTRLARQYDDRDRDQILEHALAAAQAEPEPRLRLGAAIEIALTNPALLTAVIDCVAATSEVSLKVRALRELVISLPEEASASVITAASQLLSEDRLSRLLIDLPTSLPASAIETALSAMAGLNKGVLRARALAAFADRLDDQHQPRCIEVWEAIDTDFAWVELLAALSARWPEILTPDRASRACTFLRDIDDDEFSSIWLKQTAENWPESAWSEFLGIARRLPNEAARHDILSTVLDVHPGKPPMGFLEVAREIKNVYYRVLTLGHTASVSSPTDQTLLNEALELADRALHNELYIDALVGICTASRCVTVPVFERLLTWLKLWPDRILQAWIDLSAWLNPDQAVQILQALDSGPLPATPALRANLLFGLAARLTPQEFPHLLQSIPRLCGERESSSLLYDLAPLISDEAARDSALETALSMQSEVFRAQALIGLAERMDPPRQARLVTALVDTTSERERVRRLITIWHKIDPSVEAQWQQAAQGLRDPDSKAKLHAVVSQLAQADQQTCRESLAPEHDNCKSTGSEKMDLDTLLNELTDATQSQTRDRPQSSTAPQPERWTLAEAEAHLERLDAEIDRFEFLKRTLPGLPTDESVTLINLLPKYLEPEHQDDLLRRIYARLPSDQRDPVLASIRQIQDAPRLHRLLPELAPLVDGEAISAWHQLLQETLNAASGGEREELLALLEAWVPLIVQMGGDRALVDTIQAINDAGFLWP
jgi:hypothetical protein